MSSRRFDVPRREVKAQRVPDVALVVRAVEQVFMVDVVANSSPAALVAMPFVTEG